jgi:hypothetical protein
LTLDDSPPDDWYLKKHGRRFVVTIGKTPTPALDSPKATRQELHKRTLSKRVHKNPTPKGEKVHKNPTPLILSISPLLRRDIKPSSPAHADQDQDQDQDTGFFQSGEAEGKDQDEDVTTDEDIDILPADTVDLPLVDPEPEDEDITPAQALDTLPANTTELPPIDPMPEPIPETPAAVDPTLPPPAISSIPDGDLPPPDWDRITEADLHAMTRLEPLYEQVIARGIIPCSPSTRLDFVTAAVRAREEGDNPPALFRTLVTNGLWAHATGEQEDTAHAMLKKHDWGPLPPLHLRLAPKAVPPPALSADAKTVETVRKWLRTEPYRGDPFHAFKRFADESRDWDRARWTAACDELDAKGIQDRGQ